MAVIESPRPEAPLAADALPTADRPAGFALTLEHAAYAVLFVLALIVHLWGLGDRALHHDETLHAYFSWLLFKGDGLLHDPLLHGPFLYNIVAFTYMLFGDTDATARLSVALFGSALVVMPYLVRRELGRGAALAAAVYLLISPAFLYVGRFIRHDMFAVVFELLTFISIVRYASTRQARWLYIGAVAMGLMCTTMETFYLYSAIFGGLLGVIFLWRFWRPGLAVGALLALALVALVFVLPGKPEGIAAGGGANRQNGPYSCPGPENLSPPDNPIIAKPGPLFGWRPLETADNNYALCVRNQGDDNLVAYFAKLGQFVNHPAILLAILLSLGGLGGFYWLIWRSRDSEGLSRWERAQQAGDSTSTIFASLGRDRRVWIALGAFLVPYVLFFTTFFSHPSGIVSGAAGSLLYWLAQHDVQRGGQPWYYYLVQLVVYEPIALLWGLVGLVMAVLAAVRLVRGRLSYTPSAEVPEDNAPAPQWAAVMPLLLAWWAVATFTLYSWAGEKMPWLTVHVALPLVLLGAWAFGRIAAAALPQPAPEPRVETVPLQADGQPDGADAPAGAPAPEGEAGPFWRGPLLVYLGVFGAIAGLCWAMLTIMAQPDGSMVSGAPILPLLGLVLVAILTVLFSLVYGVRRAFGALAVGLALVGALYGLRSSYQLSFRWGDIPRELLIYNTTSPDVVRVIRGLETALSRSNNTNAVVWYDNETVWDWYTHRMNAVEQPSSLPNRPDDNVAAVLMLQENLDANPQIRQNWSGFVFQRYPLRWALPEYQTYRLPTDWTSAQVTPTSPLLMRILRNPTDGQTFAQLWQYMMFRQLPAPIDSTDFVLAVRPELAPDVGGPGTGGGSKPNQP